LGKAIAAIVISIAATGCASTTPAVSNQAEQWKMCAVSYATSHQADCVIHGHDSALSCWGSMGVKQHVTLNCGAQPADVPESFWRTLGETLNSIEEHNT
jgi:hypothetical protein